MGCTEIDDRIMDRQRLKDLTHLRLEVRLLRRRERHLLLLLDKVCVANHEAAGLELDRTRLNLETAEEKLAAALRDMPWRV